MLPVVNAEAAGLELARRVKEKVESENIADEEEREWRTEQLNVIEQMNHLITYPYIKEKFRQNRIQIYGWHYIIETGEVYNFDKDAHVFRKIE